MSWRSIEEILDYEFCPKYWESMREQRFYNLSTTLLLERFDRRLKGYSENQQTKKINTKYKKKKKGRSKRRNENKAPIFAVSAILMGLLFYYDVFYFFLLLMAILLLLYFYFRYSKKQSPKSSKTNDVYLLFKEEVTINSKLELLDPPSSPYSKNTNTFGVIPNIKWENKKFVITMDRSDFQLPKYAQHASHRDLIELVFYMYLINTNFLTTKITGIIQYQDDTRTIEWSANNYKKSQKNKFYIDKNKINKSLYKIGKISEAIKKYNSQKKMKVHFTRCEKCPLLKQGCKYAKYYPKMQIPTKFKEDVEQTYQQFGDVVTQLEKTTWHHWKDQISVLANIIQSSPIIQKYIKSQVLESKIYDIGAMVDTAIFNQNEMHNGHFPSNEYPSFCYQLLLYLAEVRKDRLKPLMAAYGQTKRYDYKTSDDIKVRNFINKTILQGRFLHKIGAMLEEHLEKIKTDKTTVVNNHFRQVLKIENNQGTIIQPTIKNR